MIGLIRVALKLGAVALMATAGVARVAEHPKSTHDIMDIMRQILDNSYSSGRK